MHIEQPIVPCTHADGVNLANTMFYMGSLMSFLVTGANTGGRFALMQFDGKKGNEPPPHLHEWEDEVFYILEGGIEFYAEDVRGSKKVGVGEMIFLPQGKVHAMRILSERVRALIFVQAASAHPVGLDAYFAAMATPATSLELPRDAVTYALADPERAIEAGNKFGISFATPEETSRKLPDYPGFRETNDAGYDDQASLAQSFSLREGRTRI